MKVNGDNTKSVKGSEQYNSRRVSEFSQKL